MARWLGVSLEIRVDDMRAGLARMQREPAGFAGAHVGIDGLGRDRRRVCARACDPRGTSRASSRAPPPSLPASSNALAPVASMKKSPMTRRPHHPSLTPAMSGSAWRHQDFELLRRVRATPRRSASCLSQAAYGIAGKVIAVVGEPVTLDLRVRHQHAAVLRRGGRQAEILERHRQSVVPRLDPVRQELGVVDARARASHTRGRTPRPVRSSSTKRLPSVKAPRVAEMRRASSMRSRACSGSSAGRVA